MTAKAKLISVQIQRHLIGPAEITWLIAGLSLDVCAQPLKWPRSLEGLLKCRFAALISLEGPGICVFNRHPWRLMEVGHRAQVERWWASDTKSLSREGLLAIHSPPSAPKVLFTVLPACHVPRHTLTATHHLAPVLVCSSVGAWIFLSWSIAAKNEQDARGGSVITARPTLANIVSKGRTYSCIL